MIIKKVTTGFVIQTFDTAQKRFMAQEFIAGECVYENAKGEPANPGLMKQEDVAEPYLPFDMRQPDEKRDFSLHELDSTYADKEADDPKTPQEAVNAALALTTDDDSLGTQWYCFDRASRKLDMVEQQET